MLETTFRIGPDRSVCGEFELHMSLKPLGIVLPEVDSVAEPAARASRTGRPRNIRIFLKGFGKTFEVAAWITPTI